MPAEGPGTFVAVDSSGGRTGAGENPVTYRIEVEDGVPVEASGFAAAVEQILAVQSGWTSAGDYSFQRDVMAPVRIVLATPVPTDRLCAPLQTNGEVSGPATMWSSTRAAGAKAPRRMEATSIPPA